MLVSDVGRLQHNVPIVGEDGKPTPQFIRQWEVLQRLLADLERRITELEGAP